VIKRLGIMTAMDEEFRHIAEIFPAEASQKIGPRSFHSAKCGDLEIVLVTARIGKVAAAVTTAALIHQFGVDGVLFVGVAGGVDPALTIGDIVIGDRLIQHDIDLKGVLGYSRFQIPLLNVREMVCAPHLVRVAQVAASKVIASSEYARAIEPFSSKAPRSHVGLIASGDTFVCEAVERDALSAAIPGLKCVEMEGAAAAQVCVEHGVPFVVTRIISDHASREAPIDFAAFIRDAASLGSGIFVRNFISSLVTG